MVVSLEESQDHRLFIYNPIATDSIRLFRFHKDLSYSIPGTLKTFRLVDAPPYFALSYCWGRQEQVVPIHIDGQMLFVSPSLASAMRRLQELSGEDPPSDVCVKWVWIDKICINQADILERSRQVQIMGSIFSGAIRTLVWLGLDSSCSIAWLLIDQIYGIFNKDHPCANFLADIPFRIYSGSRHAALGLPGWDHHLWQALRELFELPWFTRIWIIQEVALSREDPVILHGQHQYPWHRLGWASAWLRRNGYLRQIQVPNEIQNVDIISSIRRSRINWHLDALLVATSIKCHATDQRDKVYALLGLAAETQDPANIPVELRPDYGLDISEVYTQLARFLFWKYKTLATLTRTSGVPGGISQARRKYSSGMLPSWVPNWCDLVVPGREIERSLSWLTDSATTGAETLGFPDHYNAAAGLPAKLFESPDSSVLRVSGFKVGTVVSAIRFDNGPGLTGGHAREPPLLRFWRAALPLLGEKQAMDWITSYINVTTVEQHRLSGNTREQILKDGSAYLLHLFLSDEGYRELYLISPVDGQHIIGILRALAVGGDLETYASLSSNFCFNRTFIITSNGLMGISPVDASPGDCIAVIFGGEVPYILRRLDCGFIFVGESYIHGVMGGEAIQAWQQSKLVEEILELR